MTEETPSKKYSIVNARLPRDENKNYYLAQLQTFANGLSDEFQSVQYGKQDIRGGHSITLFYKNHTCTGLKYFTTFKELLAFVVGWNASKDAYYTQHFKAVIQ